jgi:hypothetical protein
MPKTSSTSRLTRNRIAYARPAAATESVDRLLHDIGCIRQTIQNAAY